MQNVRVQPSKLSRKLRIKAGYSCLVLNAPDGYLSRLDPLPEGSSVSSGKGAGSADMVQLFVADRAQVERDFESGFRALKPGGLLWLTYPSVASGVATDLSRHHGWSVVHTRGLTAMDPVSLDDEWDAMRFRPVGDLKGRTIPNADMLPVGRRASAAFRFVRLVAMAVFRLSFRFDVKGRERLPNQAYVLICNHLGWMDAISLLLLFPSEPRIHYLADPTSMMTNRPLWALVMATGGIVPVNRAQRHNELLFKHVDRCLRAGGVVAIFPEGDLGPREGDLLPFKKGFAHFAVSAGVPVLPVALGGMKEVWLGKRFMMRIGEPIPTTGKTVDEVHALGQQAVNDLLPPYREPSGPKPLRRWLTGLF